MRSGSRFIIALSGSVLASAGCGLIVGIGDHTLIGYASDADANEASALHDGAPRDANFVDSSLREDAAIADASTFDVSDAPTAIDASLDGGSPADSAPSSDSGSVVDASDGGCGRIALFGGAASVLYTATIEGNGATVVTPTTFSSQGPGALIALPGGHFFAASRESNDQLFFLSNAGASTWTAPAIIPGYTSPAAPSLYYAASSQEVGIVFFGSGTSAYYYAGLYDGSSWTSDGSSGQQGVAAPASLSTSTGAIVVASIPGSGTACLAEEAVVGALWTSSFDSMTCKFPMANVKPAVVPLSGGASDALVVFNNSNVAGSKLLYSTRTAGTWAAPAILNVNSVSEIAVSLAPLTNGRAIVSWRDQGTQVPYTSIFDPNANPVWSTQVPLVTTQAPVVAAAPAITIGTCGDDAVAVFPVTSGDAQLVRMRGGVWKAATSVTGFTGATYVSIATAP